MIKKYSSSPFDRPEVLMHLFYPRPEFGRSEKPEGFRELMIPVDEDIFIGARFYEAGKNRPVILFFHGNGEIVEDYDDIAPFFVKMGINFFPVDYRGYGRSGGRPSVAAMMNDCHNIFQFVKTWLGEQGYTGRFVVMGRSLGSASAIELASSYPDQVDALVVESGFANVLPLLELLGIDVRRLGLTEDNQFRNDIKIRDYVRPTLVIHAKMDHIIPYRDGQQLLEASGAKDKKLLTIPDANHNTILYHGLREYMNEIKILIEKINR